MTTQETLEKAIQKAIGGGWLKPAKKPIKSVVVQVEDGDCYIQFWRGMNDMAWSEMWDSYHELIFDHDFAKALWGEHYICDYCGEPWKQDIGWNNTCEYCQEWTYGVKKWRQELQQMVLAEDPIKYLGEHL